MVEQGDIAFRTRTRMRDFPEYVTEQEPRLLTPSRRTSKIYANILMTIAWAKNVPAPTSATSGASMAING